MTAETDSVLDSVSENAEMEPTTQQWVFPVLLMNCVMAFVQQSVLQLTTTVQVEFAVDCVMEAVEEHLLIMKERTVE